MLRYSALVGAKSLRTEHSCESSCGTSLPPFGKLATLASGKPVLGASSLSTRLLVRRGINLCLILLLAFNVIFFGVAFRLQHQHQWQQQEQWGSNLRNGAAARDAAASRGVISSNRRQQMGHMHGVVRQAQTSSLRTQKPAFIVCAFCCLIQSVARSFEHLRGATEARHALALTQRAERGGSVLAAAARASLEGLGLIRPLQRGGVPGDGRAYKMPNPAVLLFCYNR